MWVLLIAILIFLLPWSKICVGLTHEEIDFAIERSGAGSDVVPPPIVDRLQTNTAASIPGTNKTMRDCKSSPR